MRGYFRRVLRFLKKPSIILFIIYIIAVILIFVYPEYGDDFYTRVVSQILIFCSYFLLRSSYSSNLYKSFSRRFVKYICISHFCFFFRKDIPAFLEIWAIVFGVFFLFFDMCRVYFYESIRIKYRNIMLGDYQKKLVMLHKLIISKNLKDHCGSANMKDLDKELEIFMKADLSKLDNQEDLFSLLCDMEDCTNVDDSYTVNVFDKTENNKESNKEITITSVRQDNELKNTILDIHESHNRCNYNDIDGNNCSEKYVGRNSNNNEKMDRNASYYKETDENNNIKESNKNNHSNCEDNGNNETDKDNNNRVDYVNNDAEDISQSINPILKSEFIRESDQFIHDLNTGSTSLDISEIKYRKTNRYKITKESIKKVCSPESAEDIFFLLNTFLKNEINHKTFNENINQLKKEIKSFQESLKQCKDLFTLLNLILIISQCIFLVCVILKGLGISFQFMSMFLSLFFFTFFPSIKQVIEAFFFVLVNHPFDCGDRIHYKDENLVVKKINLFSTQFDKWNGEPVIINNQALSIATIKNIKRSPPQKWSIPLIINREDLGKLEHLESNIKDLLENNPRFEKILFSLEEISKGNYLIYNIIIYHKSNFFNGFFMWRAHSKIVQELKKSLKKNNIVFYPIKKEVELIN